MIENGTLSLGIDFSATTIKIGIVDPHGNVVERRHMSTNGHQNKETFLDSLTVAIQQMELYDKVDTIGIGFCGIIDVNRGVILKTTKTLDGWSNYPIVQALENRLNRTCICDNDGNLAAYAEYVYGAGRFTQSLVMIILGTGVGGGIVINGKIIRGPGFTAGHLGHMKVGKKGRPCPCGGIDCLESYASSFALRQAYGKEVDELFKDARQGFTTAQSLVSDAAAAIGKALADLSCIVNPDIFIIGGGISNSFNMLKDEIISVYQQHALMTIDAESQVVISNLGDDAALIGAAILFQNSP